MKNISELFSKTRKMQGIKQSYVAESLGVTHGAVGQFEAGSSALSIHNLAKYAAIINIDPLYISSDSSNPFKSDDLIKMFLPESMMQGIDFEMIYFIASKNKKLKIVFLIAPLLIYKKLLSIGVFENPVYAIIIKDDNNNTFLFRRKNKNNPLYGERKLQLELSKMRFEFKIKIYKDIKEIDDDLTKKIKDWTVEKKDIEPLFSDVMPYLESSEEDQYSVIPYKEENDLLKFIRKNNIAPQDVIDYLKSKTPESVK